MKTIVSGGEEEAYNYNYEEAVRIFSLGLDKYPNSYKLLRHRGHRYISLRQFDLAVKDLERARRLMPLDSIEVEPDGMPNRLNIPLSNAQNSIRCIILGLPITCWGTSIKPARSMSNACAFQ